MCDVNKSDGVLDFDEFELFIVKAIMVVSRKTWFGNAKKYVLRRAPSWSTRSAGWSHRPTPVNPFCAHSPECAEHLLRHKRPFRAQLTD